VVFITYTLFFSQILWLFRRHNPCFNLRRLSQATLATASSPRPCQT